MAARSSIQTPKHQQGLALLILIIILVLASTSYMFSEISIPQIKADHDKNTQVNLKKARQAVIDYAVTYADRGADNDYGLLPHPEVFFNGNDGNMSSVGGAKNVSALGWFPWRSLDITNLKDNSGTCLFYAVSGSYKLHATLQADMINEDSIGTFRVMNSNNVVLQGASTDRQVVALVIAPGAPLPGRPARAPTLVDSSCGRDYNNVSAYLEGNGVYDNSTLSVVPDDTDDFIHATDRSGTEATPYNDRFLTITREEIWNAIVNRSDFKQKMENLTQGLAMCLANYANLPANNGRRLPWPAFTDLAGADYRANNNYDDDNDASNGFSGRFPFIVDDSNNAVSATLVDDELFEVASCDMPGGLAIDLRAPGSEYRKLWNNWKDHFFYVLSKEYEADNGGPKECTGEPCIKVNGNTYAAAVIFSGSRLPGVTRIDKSIVAEYLEDGKAAEFNTEAIDQNGDRNYLYTDPQTDTQNDIMYCVEDKVTLTDKLTVVECS